MFYNIVIGIIHVFNNIDNIIILYIIQILNEKISIFNSKK